jgi:hypothetical protein
MSLPIKSESILSFAMKCKPRAHSLVPKRKKGG